MKRPILLIVVLLFAGAVHGATARLDTTVIRLITDETLFGGCMAELADRPDSEGLDCRLNRVTFSCTGDFTSVPVANRNFEMAQLAMLTNAPVFVFVDDARKHNGYCYAYRVHLFQGQ